MLFDESFTVFRCDRNLLNSHKKRSGGVLIAVRNVLPSSVLSVGEQSLEHVWVTVRLNGYSLIVGAIYIPPDVSSDHLVLRRHIDCFEGILASLKNRDKLIVLGDYNLPGLRWMRLDRLHCSVDVTNSNLTRSSTTLIDGMYLNNMEQINYIKNHAGNTLDLVFINEAVGESFDFEEAADPLIAVDSHHPPTVLSFHKCASLVNYVDEIDHLALDFRRANFDDLNNQLSDVDWSPILNSTDVNEGVNAFTHVLQQVFSTCVPQQRPPVKPPWSNRELRINKRRRNAAYRIYRKHRTTLNKANYKAASRRHKKLNNQLYRRYARKVERDLKRNPKQFWNFVNSKRKNVGLPSMMHLDHRRANTSVEKCSLFAEFFNSVFDDHHGCDTAVEALDGVPRDVIDVDTFTVTVDALNNAVSKLKISYRPGPDGIPSCVLEKCFSNLVPPLLHIYNLSMRQSLFPTMWKASFMFPVHKKDAKENVRNYRGITSLCACSKLLEIIIGNYLLAQTKHYISVNQHGFFPGRSVTTNLVEFASSCTQQIGRGQQIDAVYTDLKAAFDRVSHAILLAKLEKLGATPRFVAWLRSYLCGRKLAVKIGSSISTWFTNSSGVPQGSNLGPLLFSLFFNDVVLFLGEGFCILYADDLKIYVIVNSTTDCIVLQNLLDRLLVWCRANKMTLSVSKCAVISFHRKKRFLQHDYLIGEEQLARVDTVRDLGVVLDSELKFKQHYEEIIKKARRQLGFVTKVTNEFQDPYTLKSLYVSLVRPILETSSIVWDPYQATMTNRIEKVQRKFIRYALRNLPWNDRYNLPPYEERCRLIGLDTLEYRRKVAKAGFVAKILAADIDAPNLLARLDINVPIYTLRSSDFFRLPRRRHDYDLNEPVRSMMSIFNDMFAAYDFNISSNEFRRRI